MLSKMKNMICFCYLLFEVYVMKQKIKTIGMISPSIMLSEAGLQEDKWLPYLESLGLKVLMAPSALKGKRQYPVSAQEKAFDIIVFTQSMSEKGIRHLLREYLELHQPEIISIVLKK